MNGDGFLYEDHPFDSTRKVWNVAIQIIEGLIHIHSNNFICGDLKPENIWIFNGNQLKIGNFFLFPTREQQNPNYRANFPGGTPYYWSYEQGMAFETTIENPNLASTLDFDFSTDFYSFGLILKEILCGGRRPWRVGHKIDHIIGEKSYFSCKFLEKASQILDKLAEKCLKKKPSDRPPGKAILVELVQGYLAVFPSKKELLWKPFFNQDSEKMNDLNNTCVCLYNNQKFAQAKEGWISVLETQRDHLHAFFNYSLVNSMNSIENPSSQILADLNKAQPSKLRDFFRFLCKVRSRQFLFKKHQIPNHLLFEGSPRSKIIEVMSFLDSEKKAMKKRKTQQVEVSLKGFEINEHYICIKIINEGSQIVLVSLLDPLNEHFSSCSIKIILFCLLEGKKLYETPPIKVSQEFLKCKNFEIVEKSTNLIVWTNNLLLLIETKQNEIKFLKEEPAENLIFLKFSSKNTNEFYIALRDKEVRRVEFPTMRVLETILVFSIENSIFSFFEIIEDASPVVLLAQREAVKFHCLNHASAFPKEIKTLCKTPIKQIRHFKSNEKNDFLAILSSDSLEIRPFSKKNQEKILLQGQKCEEIQDFIISQSKEIVLAFEKQGSSLIFWLFHLKESLVSQNFSLENVYPTLPLILKEDNALNSENEFLRVLILDKYGTMKPVCLDLSTKTTELIRKVWTPEEAGFQDLELDLMRNYYLGLTELVETWKAAEDLGTIYEVAENGKFFWDFKYKIEIKTLFLELNSRNKAIEKVNESSEEGHFDDFTTINAFAISVKFSLIAISEYNTKFIKIIQITEPRSQLKLKNVLEFDYCQDGEMGTRTEILAFSESAGENAGLLLFHCANDCTHGKFLGFVIWGVTENRLVKKLDFGEKCTTMMMSFCYSDQNEKVFFFFKNGSCFYYDFGLNDVFEESLMSQEKPIFVLGFYFEESQNGIALCSDHIIRVYDIKNQEITKIIYLSGEPILSSQYQRVLKRLDLVDLNENLHSISGFSTQEKIHKTIHKLNFKKWGKTHFFDFQEEKKHIIAGRDQNILQIYDLKKQKSAFKYSFQSEGSLKAAYWLQYPSKILVIGSNFVKTIYLYWEWK